MAGGRPNSHARDRVFTLPATTVGWVAAGAGGATLVSIAGLLLLPLVDDPAPRQGLAVLASGCAVLAIVSGALAITRTHERSLLVWLAIIPGLLWVSYLALLFYYVLFVMN